MLSDISALVLGPTGIGKSSFLASALKHEGSGAVAVSPHSEVKSYEELRANANYQFAAFDDPEFQPLLGEWKADGWLNFVRWLKTIYAELKEDKAAGRPLRYKVLGLDTATALGKLGYNQTLNKFKMIEPPAARSPEGAAFYSYLTQVFDSGYRIARSINGLGVHWIATGHQQERENVSEAVIDKANVGSKIISLQMAGGYKDILPSFFDLVLHAGMVKKRSGDKVTDVHYLQWKPSLKRPTKSRIGALSENDLIPNNWPEVMQRMEAALAKRAA